MTRMTVPCSEVQGIRILDLARLDDGEDHSEQLVSALSLLARVDQRSVERMRGHFRAIIIGVGSNFSFAPDLRVCYLPVGYQENRPIEQIASYLAHEAMHALLFSRGIGYSESVRLRVERACIRAERALARKLPVGETLLHDVERRMNARNWRTDEELLDRRERDFRDNGVADFLLRLRRRVLVGALPDVKTPRRNST
jgi:hypothetical protein